MPGEENWMPLRTMQVENNKEESIRTFNKSTSCKRHPWNYPIKQETKRITSKKREITKNLLRTKRDPRARESHTWIQINVQTFF